MGRIGRTCLVTALLVLATAAPAFGQSVRTWVTGSGGSDANPCSRTAPCQTFAGAILKTFENGEINVIDSGAYGGVTINKAITIDGHGNQAGVLASGTHGIIINTSKSDARVVIRDLDINGTGANGTVGEPTGITGIRVDKARSVKVVNTRISNFRFNGIHFRPNISDSRLFVRNARIHDNRGAGVLVGPQTGGGARVSIRKSEIDDNGCGIVAATYGSPTLANPATNCGTATSTSGISVPATIGAYDNSITESDDAGVFSHGVQSVIRLGGNEISGNETGLRTLSTGSIVSWGNNFNIGNTTNGSPTVTIPTN